MEGALTDASDKRNLSACFKFDQCNEVKSGRPAIYRPLILSGLLVIMQYQQGHCRMEGHLLGDTPMEEVIQETPM